MLDSDIQRLLKQIPKMTEAQLRDLYATVEEHEVLASREKARKSFMAFVKKVWPHFIEGPHHKRMAAAFEQIGRAHV